MPKFVKGKCRKNGKIMYTALKQLKRRVFVTQITSQGIIIEENVTIPAYVVGYKGFFEIRTLQEQMSKLNHAEQGEPFDIVRGILQFEPKTIFVGSDGSVLEDGAALGAFINSLHWELHRTSPLSWPNLPAYYEDED